MNDIFVTLDTLLADKAFPALKVEINKQNPVDAAAYLMTLGTDTLPLVFRLLTKDNAADVFAELDIDAQEMIINCATDKELSAIVEDLCLDDAVDMVEELPAGVVTRIMKTATEETRSLINRFLSYPEDSAGSVMTAEFIDFKKTMTSTEAIGHVRSVGKVSETVYVGYVTDKSRKLEGIIDLKDLLFASPDDRLENIMDTSIVSAYTHDDKETVASLISKYDLLALPVTDSEGRLVGIVTVDDAIDVLQDEATEDIAKMAAVTPQDTPYLKTSVFGLWKARIPWLLILMVSATFTGSIIRHYEAALSAYVALTAFIPMLMDTGGNAGGQASVTIIRGLSLGELGMKNIMSILWKELRVSLLCGVSLAAVAFGKTMLIDKAGVTVSIVVSLTLLCAVVIAKLIGSSLPILAKRIGFDPAVMASPFITTVVDSVSLIIYFNFASTLLGISA